MKKNLLLALLLPALGFSQENDKPKGTLSIGYEIAAMEKIGIAFEFPSENKFLGMNNSFTMKVAYGSIEKTTGLGKDITGNGFVGTIGTKFYTGTDKWSGLYFTNEFEGGTIEFDDTVMGYRIEGTYRYLSLVSPSLGYKFQIGKFSIDPSVGFQWLIEMKGKGAVDNNEFDNTAVKAGLQIGYSF